MNNKKIIRIATDCDGVIATHSLKGFWVKLRVLKEKILRKVHSPAYYYPSTMIEKFVWEMINWLRKPFLDGNGLFPQLAGKSDVQFYLVTGRFKFLEKQTKDWLKKYQLQNFFHKILVNIDDIDPIVFKAKAIKKFNLDYFIDDDLEVLNYLKKHTKAKLYWIVPGPHRKSENGDKQIENCRDFLDALKKIFKIF